MKGYPNCQAPPASSAC